jgi:hypothetical protein
MAERASPERLDEAVQAGRQVPKVRPEAGVGNTGFADYLGEHATVWRIVRTPGWPGP